MALWLRGCLVEFVAMESTGVFVSQGGSAIPTILLRSCIMFDGGVQAMNESSLTETVKSPITDAPPKPWSLTGRIAFRFCVVYLSLYCLSNQIFGALLPIPGFELPDLTSLWPLRPMVSWTASHVFHVTSALVFTESGSGDKTSDWVLAFCLLVLAALATVLWSVMDRRRSQYVTLHKYCRLLLRFALAGQMISYGVIKAIPLQMSFPTLNRLLAQYGDFSPMGVLWSSIGASPAYEIFAGCAEILGGILLIIPRTTLLGALVCLLDMTQVFTLNMTYDVPVKLLSFHLLLFSALLLAPDFRRLVNFLLLNRVPPPSDLPPLFRTSRANRISLTVQVVFGIALLAANIWSGMDAWKQYGGGRTKSPLYGIWSVERMSIDGTVRSPLITDYGRWRHIVFDFPGRISFQRMDNSFAYYEIAIDAGHKTVALTKNKDAKWKASFRYEREVPDALSLDGVMDSHKIQMQMKLVDASKFLLVSRGFNWVQEYPFSR